MLLLCRVVFFVFMERSVKKVANFSVIWLSSNPNVQLGLWCIRVLVKPYYRLLHDFLDPRRNTKIGIRRKHKSSRFEIAGPEIGGATLIVLAL